MKEKDVFISFLFYFLLASWERRRWWKFSDMDRKVQSLFRYYGWLAVGKNRLWASINVFMVEVVEVFGHLIFFLDCARMIGVDVGYDSCLVSIDAVFSSCGVFGCCWLLVLQSGVSDLFWNPGGVVTAPYDRNRGCCKHLICLKYVWWIWIWEPFCSLVSVWCRCMVLQSVITFAHDRYTVWHLISRVLLLAGLDLDALLLSCGE
jgi:hypothetical protein